MSLHLYKSAIRNGTCQVIEEEKRILIKVRFDKYGKLGDEPELIAWLRPIFDKFLNDPRPIVMDHPTTGEIATITDVGGATMIQIQAQRKKPE